MRGRRRRPRELAAVEHLGHRWEELGRRDPLWAIAAVPGTRGGRWDVEAFYDSGRVAVAALVELLSSLDLVIEGRVLDFGCGYGRHSEALAELASRVDGVDISQAMIEGARRHSRHPDRVHYHVNRAPNLHVFADGGFDFVHSVLVLQHVGPPLVRRYLQEFARVMAPGGLLHFQLPTAPARNLGGMLVRSTPAVLRRRLRELAIEPLPEREVRHLLSRLGLELLDVRPDESAGARWRSRRYTARRLPVSSAP